MALPNVIINLTNSNGRKAPGQDHISGLVCGAVDVSGSGNFDVGTIYELDSVKAAENIGITAAYDLAEGVAVHHHISRFFLRCPGGTLYLLGVAQGTSLEDMADKTLSYAKQLITATNGAVRQIGLVLNPDMGTYSPTLTTGLDADVIAAIPKAQALCDEALAAKRPLVVYIEGREFNGSVGSALNLRTKNAPNVGVVIAQDAAFAASNAAFADTAAVGDVLGLSAKFKVNQSLGNRKSTVGQTVIGRLDVSTAGAFAQANLSSGSTVESYGNTSLGTLYDKGYIVPIHPDGLDGYYLAGSPSCTVATSDYAFMERARTINKAVRLLNAKYAIEVNADRLLNDDGTLEGQEVGDLEAIGENALQPMKQDGEISNCNVYIDPAQNVEATDAVAIQVGITPVGITKQITINLGYGLIPTQQ